MVPLVLCQLFLHFLYVSLLVHVVLVVVLAAHKDKRPAFDAIGYVPVLEVLEVFKDLSLLLFSAAEALVLILVLLDGGLWFGHLIFALSNIAPVDISEELMPLDLVSAFWASTESPARVAVEQVDNQVLGLEGHADWKLEHAALNVVEKFSPKQKKCAGLAIMRANKI